MSLSSTVPVTDVTRTATPGRMPAPVIAMLCGLLAAAPWLVDTYYLHAIITSLIFLLPAHGLNLLVGYTGLLSLASGAFFGIGSYVSALLAIHFGTPFWFNFVAAGVVTGLIALPLGVPALRLRTYSFVMCTLGFVVIGEAVAKNWISLTRGDMGLSGIPTPDLGFGFKVTGIVGFYYLYLGLAIVMTALFYALIHSPAGRCMIAIRDNEIQAEALGIPTWTYKLVVFTLSAAFAGLGGSMFAHYLTTISPLTFQMYYSTTILIIVLGGGAGTIRGVVAGSLVFVAVSEALRIAPELRMIIYGFVLLLLVFWLPKGITPLIDRVMVMLGGRR